MIEFWLVLVIIVAVLGYYQVRDNRCTIRYDDQDVPYKLEPRKKNVRVKKVNKRSNNNKKKSVKRKASITKLKKNTKRTRRTTSVEKNKKR